jgi:hypothetical protein
MAEQPQPQPQPQIAAATLAPVLHNRRIMTKALAFA